MSKYYKGKRFGKKNDTEKNLKTFTEQFVNFNGQFMQRDQLIRSEILTVSSFEGGIENI